MKTLWLAAALLVCGAALADDGDYWYLQTSVYTTHWSHDPIHNNNQDLIGVERHKADGEFAGIATFRNSYRQRTQYAYVGKRFDADSLPVYLKVSAGAIQGYRGEYRDKIPLNRYGVAPVIIPSLGLQMGPVSTEAVFFGNAGAMLNIGTRI
ncbi:sn-glycerol-3-phosphate transporter [Aquipseudomonas alcaligenes]|uniref:sn-glycerol-3-phosphate transporter n=1 Tax=Aquipseudomonas alcaligenes TaxID=43263 RepID=UPI003747A6AB